MKDGQLQMNNGTNMQKHAKTTFQKHPYLDCRSLDVLPKSTPQHLQGISETTHACSEEANNVEGSRTRLDMSCIVMP